jgi:glycosyltransferase involved in cell wall biosynthesis
LAPSILAPMSRPLVSVVMPTYNRQALLDFSFESVLNVP